MFNSASVVFNSSPNQSHPIIFPFSLLCTTNAVCHCVNVVLTISAHLHVDNHIMWHELTTPCNCTIYVKADNGSSV